MNSAEEFKERFRQSVENNSINLVEKHNVPEGLERLKWLSSSENYDFIQNSLEKRHIQAATANVLDPDRAAEISLEYGQADLMYTSNIGAFIARLPNNSGKIHQYNPNLVEENLGLFESLRQN